MGYSADAIEIDFTIPAENVAAALAAINASDVAARGFTPGTYASLIAAVEDITSFEDCTESDQGFSLGYHADKYLSETEWLLRVLGKFAKEDSYVRFCGEDYSFWGFKVIEGLLHEETGEVVWQDEGLNVEGRNTRT